MENFLSDMERRNLVHELSQGRELAEQLQVHLLQSSLPDAGRVLLNQISSSFELALSLINHGGGGAVGGSFRPGTGGVLVAMSAADPPHQSLTGNSPTDVSDDHKSKDQANKKRRWTRKVEACGDTGVEGLLDDGYGWRKYEQKEILGAKFTRHGQGCLATKQIQRSDYDPNVLDITYSGIHTCDPTRNPGPTDPPTPIINTRTQLETLSLLQNNHQFIPQSHQHFYNVQTSLRAMPQDSHTFNFPSPSNIQPQSFITSDDRQVIHNLHVSESEAYTTVLASTTSDVHSPTCDTGFPPGTLYEFGSGFSFEHQGK